MAQTDKQTDILTNGHGDSMTESAQWGQFSVKSTQLPNPNALSHFHNLEPTMQFQNTQKKYILIYSYREFLVKIAASLL